MKMSPKAYPGKKKRVVEMFRFFHLIFSLAFKLKRDQTKLLGNFGQPTSMLRGSVCRVHFVPSRGILFPVKTADGISGLGSVVLGLSR